MRGLGQVIVAGWLGGLCRVFSKGFGVTLDLGVNEGLYGKGGEFILRAQSGGNLGLGSFTSE